MYIYDAPWLSLFSNAGFQVPLHNGESLAHEEIASRYKVEFEYLPHATCENPHQTGWARFLVFFRVKSIGVRADPGLTSNLTAIKPHYKRFDRLSSRA